MSEATGVRLATHAMGCRFELLLSGAPEASLRAAGEEAVALIEDAHDRLTRFEAGSVVSRLNRMREERVDAELLDLFEQCESVRRESEGAFDITLGGSLLIDHERASVRLERGMIDLGAIGKGFAVDIAIRSLEEAGITSAFVHASTSTARSIGRRPDGGPWTARVATEGREPLHVDLTDRALSVSGDEVQGAHMIDPHTGEPAPEGAFGACIGTSATLCDAWSTAIAVQGKRLDGTPQDIITILKSDGGWRIEPGSEEKQLCQNSIDVLS